MKNTTNRGLMAGIYIKLLPLALLHGVILCLCGGSLEAQDCVNCTRGEIEMGGTFSDTLALNTDCRHTGGAGPPYDIIRYEQTETGCVTFTTSSTCDTMLELLDRDGCLAFIQNNDCATWEAEGLQGIQNSCLSLRLCPGIYYLCLYPMAPCEGWPDISDWEYTVRVSGCIEEPEIPANDSCSNAIPLELNTPVIGTTLHASCDAAPDCADDPRSGLAWYRFTGTGSEIELNTCSPSTAIQARVAVYTGDCASLACAEVKRIGCLGDRETVLLDTIEGVECRLLDGRIRTACQRHTRGSAGPSGRFQRRLQGEHLRPDRRARVPLHWWKADSLPGSGRSLQRGQPRGGGLQWRRAPRHLRWRLDAELALPRRPGPSPRGTIRM